MMMIDIDPNCYTSMSSSTYNKPIGDLYVAGQINRALVYVEVDSVGGPSTPIYPVPTSEDIAMGMHSRRNVAFSVRPRYIDETMLSYAMTGLQGSFMFQLAELVQRGILRCQVSVSGGAYAVKSHDKIVAYAVNVAGAVPAVWS